MWLITLISWRITNTIHLTISSYEHFDYHYWLLPCHATLPSPVQRQSSSRQRDPTSAPGKTRNMATKKLWKWHAIAPIPHLLRLLFLDLGARAPKTSQLMTHRTVPKNPPPNPGPKFCTKLVQRHPVLFWAITKIVFCGGKWSHHIYTLLDSRRMILPSSPIVSTLWWKMTSDLFWRKRTVWYPFPTEPWFSQEGYTNVHELPHYLPQLQS